MIYTLTLNPSLDYTLWLESLRPGEMNRVSREEIFPGGKGINVSIVLKNLGHESTALGFIAGFTGREIRSRLEGFGVSSDFIEVRKGLSRVNVKVKAGEETEINGRGPWVAEDELEALLRRLDAIEAGSILVLSGSVPACLPSDIYEIILRRLSGRGVSIAVDAERELLRRTLPCKPFFIKPNHLELGELFGVSLRTRAEVIPYARELRQMGPRNVLVSMAGEGAVLASEDGRIFESPAPAGKVINSVGAGDSMVAGFIAGLLEGHDPEYAFRLGLAAGSASAFSSGLASGEDIRKLARRAE